jgi:hypothetical protein
LQSGLCAGDDVCNFAFADLDTALDLTALDLLEVGDLVQLGFELAVEAGFVFVGPCRVGSVGVFGRRL